MNMISVLRDSLAWSKVGVTDLNDLTKIHYEIIDARIFPYDPMCSFRRYISHNAANIGHSKRCKSALTGASVKSRGSERKDLRCFQLQLI